MIERDKQTYVNGLDAMDRDMLIEFMINSHDGIFIVDKEGTLIAANPSVIELVGSSYKDLVGHQISEILTKGIYVGSPSVEAAKTGKLYTDLVKTRGGVEIMSTSNPVFDDQGNLKYVITNCRPFSLIKEFYNKYMEEDAALYEANLEDKAPTEFSYHNQTMKTIVDNMSFAAKTNCSILLLGQTGTGKGVLAKHIHRNSKRSKYRFVEINCAAIPENLLESELFGYEKGAFTGANATGKLGLLEIANKGTIFLDEIGEMPLLMQAKLLKVLDAGYIRRIGGTVDHKVNVRIISATNCNLKEMVRRGEFREDLYYRLNVISARIPPLKERREEISTITDHYVKLFGKMYSADKEFSEDAKKVLYGYEWPGNIRQLRNFIEKSMILSREKKIIDADFIKRLLQEEDDSREIQGDNEANEFKSEAVFNGETLKDYIERIENEYIKNCIEKSNGSVTKAAEKLGIHRTSLYKKIGTKSEE